MYGLKKLLSLQILLLLSPLQYNDCFEVVYKLLVSNFMAVIFIWPTCLKMYIVTCAVPRNILCTMCFFSEFRKDVFSVSVAGLGFQQQ